MDGDLLAAPLTGERVTVKELALGVLAQLGARIEPADTGVRVELDPEQLALLEGRRLPPSSLPEPRAAMYLAFSLDQESEAAELVTAGSWRLEQLVSAALQFGRLGRAWARLPGVRPALDRPYLIFHFLVAYVGYAPQEKLIPVTVDLVTADAFAVALVSPARWRLMPQGDGTPAELPRLSLGQAHERAVDALARAVREQDADWLRAARVRLERELEGLYSYCRAALDHDEAGEVETAGRTRMRELETLARPHVRARAEAATLLYIPLVRGRSGRLYNPVWQRPAPDGPVEDSQSGGPN